MKISLKFLSMMFAMFAMAISFTACSNDDDNDDDNSIATYYLNCDGVSGGGLSASECSQLQASFNADMSELLLEGLTRAEAIEVFDLFISEFVDEMGTESWEPEIRVSFSLRNDNDGSTIKSATVVCDANGAHVA